MFVFRDNTNRNVEVEEIRDHLHPLWITKHHQGLLLQAGQKGSFGDLLMIVLSREIRRTTKQ